MSNHEPFRKIVNAFIPNATPSNLVGGAALREVGRLTKLWGGLWVGGSVECSGSSLTFRPNQMNLAFHEGLETIDIPIDQIQSIHREFGWFTGIVVVKHQKGCFCFRCYSAKNVAATLSSRLGLA